MIRYVVLFVLLNTSALFAQEMTISLNANATALKTIITEIESQTPYRFYFLDKWIDTVKISVEIVNVPVESALNTIFSNLAIKHFILGEKIILTNNAHIVTQIDSTIFDQYRGESMNDLNYVFDREIQSSGTSASKKQLIRQIGIKGTSKQDRVTLAGYIRTEQTGEPIAGATVQVVGTASAGISDGYGFYTITAPSGKQTILVTSIGMNNASQNVLLYSDGKLNFSMTESVTLLKEILVESDYDVNVSGTQMGLTKIDVRTMKNIPKILGENDILKVAMTLPGVKSVGEGSAGFNVRGGNADQNLVALNEATIYNPSHFLGFFSVFNADAIKSFELFKSSIPVQYGGRLSSIFAIDMKDGNQRKFSAQGGIGPITSQLTFEIPVVKDRMSVMVGGRSTYSNWILTKIPNDAIKRSRASFYDGFVRITHRVNDKNSLYLSGYFSNDNFNLSSDSTFSYQNALASLQWRHLFGPNVQSVLSATMSSYKFNVEYARQPVSAFNMSFDIQETQVKYDININRGKHKLDVGIQSKLYALDPGTLSKETAESLVKEVQIPGERGIESAIYFGDNIDITPRLSASAGIRYSAFFALGPRSIYAYTEGQPRSNNTISDTLSFKPNTIIKTFHGPEYRVSSRYKLSDNASVKASYNRTRQYIHMLSNTVSVSPTNTWKLSDPGITPLVADQVSIGYYRDFAEKKFEASLELYNRWLRNIVDYKTGATVLLNKNIEKDVLQGDGKAHGAELLIRKKTGVVTGWLSYTYSRTFIRLKSPYKQEQVNRGEYFPANYDKPHDISVVSNYKITRRYSFGLNFNYSTGRPITYPVGTYKFGNTYRINYSDRNAYRIPDYIRVDLGFNIEGNHKLKKLAHSFWTISVYNLLGRKNPYSVYFDVAEDKIKAYKLSIFGAPIPTITYNFKF